MLDKATLTEDELRLMRKFAGIGPGFSPESPEEKRAFAALKERNFVANGLTAQGWKILQQYDDDRWSD